MSDSIQWYTKQQVDNLLAGVGGGSVAWVDITGKPANYPPAAHDHAAADITDATTVGKAVLTAADAATARSAIGAGTSNLAIGTTGSTAAAGNHNHDGTYLPAAAVSADSGNLLTFGSDDLVMLDPDDLPAGGGGAPGIQPLPVWADGVRVFDSGMNTQNNTSNHGTIGFTPLQIPFESVVLVGFSTWVQTAGSEDGLVRMGLYADADGYPGELIVDGGTIPTNTTGYKNIDIAATPLDVPGNFWLAVHQTGTTPASMPETLHTSGPHRVGGAVVPYSGGFRQLSNSTTWAGGYGHNMSMDNPLPALAPAGMSFGRWRGYGAIQITKEAGA